MLYKPLSSSAQSLQAFGPYVPADSFLAHIQVGSRLGYSKFIWHIHDLILKGIGDLGVVYHTTNTDNRASREDSSGQSQIIAYPNSSAALRVMGRRRSAEKRCSFRVFVQAYQYAPEAVQPAVGAFHHSAPGLEPCLPLEGLGLPDLAADVGSEAEPL